MIEGVRKDVLVAAESELARAKEQFGEKYHSRHEAYGVLAEELYEVKHEMKWLAFHEEDLIGALHHDDDVAIDHALDALRCAAIRAACELIQVAAVCHKAIIDPEVIADA